MIRFCDNEICCITYAELNRDVLLNYFFQNGMDNVICIIDNEGKFIGKITYYGLINTDCISDAIDQECVILNKEIWGKARGYFLHCERRINESVLLPVINERRELLCFAYEDADANREIRMLRELLENENALQFPDVFPQYKYVKIYELNELAYFFAKYLEHHRVDVEVIGQLWSGLFESKNYQAHNYNCMEVYAEGIGISKKNWVERLLQSVSAEFECIDVIYESNVKKEIIQDACVGGGGSELIKRLKREKEIVILGIGRESQNVFDFFVQNDLNICCFVDESYQEQLHKLFGLDILCMKDAMAKYANAVFVECRCKHSTWGMGGVDYYDYIGYKRNERFYLIKDYMDVEDSNLIHILMNQKVVFLGDIGLCNFLYSYFVQKIGLDIGYLDIMQQYESQENMKFLKADDLEKNVTCLIVFPEIFEQKRRKQQEEKKQQLIKYLVRNELYDYTDYFTNTYAFIKIEEERVKKFRKIWFMPKRIILSATESHCGNIFFKGLLDGHPSILMLYNCSLNDDLFWVCIYLCTIEPAKIMRTFWEICEKKNYLEIFHDVSAFNQKMTELLEMHTNFTSQELFVMIHIAFMYMNGRNISKMDIKDVVIYWDPHYVNREIIEESTRWLGEENVKCDILNIVRNIITVNGKVRNFFLQENYDRNKAIYKIMTYPSIEKKDYQYNDRLVIKFEDLKTHPKKILSDLCNRWGIEWSETLMTTTING